MLLDFSILNTTGKGAIDDFYEANPLNLSGQSTKSVINVVNTEMFAAWYENPEGWNQSALSKISQYTVNRLELLEAFSTVSRDLHSGRLDNSLGVSLGTCQKLVNAIIRIKKCEPAGLTRFTRDCESLYLKQLDLEGEKNTRKRGSLSSEYETLRKELEKRRRWIEKKYGIVVKKESFKASLRLPEKLDRKTISEALRKYGLDELIPESMRGV